MEKRGVKFHDNVEVYVVGNFRNCAPRIAATLWFQEYDYGRMADECTRLYESLVEQYGLGIVHDSSEEETIRGLEARNESDRERRQKLKLDAIKAVLDRQDRLWEAHTVDHVRLARSYRSFAMTAMNAARLLAIRDEEEAKRVALKIAEDPQPAPALKMLRFCPNCVVKTTLHINDCTPEEFKSYWYTYDDFKAFKAQNKLTAKKKLKKTLNEETDDTFRGLEHLVDRASKAKKTMRILAVRAVIDEQERQEQEGIWDNDLLAKASTAISEHWLPPAIEFGREDALFAQEYTAQDRQWWEEAKKLLEHQESASVASSSHAAAASSSSSSSSSFPSQCENEPSESKEEQDGRPMYDAEKCLHGTFLNNGKPLKTVFENMPTVFENMPQPAPRIRL